MNKLELINAVNRECNITKVEAETVVNILFDEMTQALTDGDRVEIRGLCSFYVKSYDAYTGRNPKTGKKVQVKPKRLPFFKCGKELKDRLNK